MWNLVIDEEVLQIEAVTEYSDAPVRRLIEKITVYNMMLIVELKSGLEVEVDV